MLGMSVRVVVLNSLMKRADLGLLKLSEHVKNE